MKTALRRLDAVPVDAGRGRNADAANVARVTRCVPALTNQRCAVVDLYRDTTRDTVQHESGQTLAGTRPALSTADSDERWRWWSVICQPDPHTHLSQGLCHLCFLVFCAGYRSSAKHCRHPQSFCVHSNFSVKIVFNFVHFSKRFVLCAG